MPVQPINEEQLEDIFQETENDVEAQASAQPSFAVDPRPSVTSAPVSGPDRPTQVAPTADLPFPGSEPVDPGASPLPPLDSPPQPPTPTQEQKPGKPRKVGRGSRLRVIILIVLVIALVVTAAIAYYSTWSSWLGIGGTQQVNPAVENLNNVRPYNANNSAANSNSNGTTVPLAADADGDGLTDEEEKELGTNTQMIDTDLDGLTDREEVQIYKTDPMSTDTDKDGYSDGEEVRNFYNPNGDGKLLDVVNVIKEYNEQNQNQ